MKDFASAAMMRLIQAGLARQGLEGPAPPAFAGAHVPLASKRAGVELILKAHGPLALLRIGEGFADVREAPLLAALETARTPHEMIDRWRRMEAYVHSKHRTSIEDASDGSITLRHVSKDVENPPQRSEDLLIFGVLIALIGWTGASGLRAKPVDDEEWVFADEWLAAPTSPDCATWRICWGEIGGDHQAVEAPGRPRTLQELIQTDPMKRWAVRDAAKELGVSARSLQRQLQAENRTFSGVVADIRAATAVRLLDTTTLSLPEIGFMSGYADQAHFTRSFKSAMAIPPKKYRSA